MLSYKHNSSRSLYISRHNPDVQDFGAQLFNHCLQFKRAVPGWNQIRRLSSNDIRIIDVNLFFVYFSCEGANLVFYPVSPQLMPQLADREIITRAATREYLQLICFPICHDTVCYPYCLTGIHYRAVPLI